MGFTTCLEPLMTVRDVMTVTRLSKAMVYRLKDEGHLPPVRLPGCKKVLFDPATVRRFLGAGRPTEASSAIPSVN